MGNQAYNIQRKAHGVKIQRNTINALAASETSKKPISRDILHLIIEQHHAEVDPEQGEGVRGDDRHVRHAY